MTTSRAFRILCGWSTAIVIVLGMSYCSEWPKYQFERVAAEVDHRFPGARLIGSMKSRNLASPVSWIWPATTTWNFAWPDPRMLDRFYTITLVYGEKEPLVFLVDADCEAREQVFYGLDGPDSGVPARDIFGQPIVAPSGKTYRRLKTKQEELPTAWLHDFCDTDWTAERKAAASTHG
jgi:hypothetical protein